MITFFEIRNDDDWEYYRLRPSRGVELERTTEDVYGLLIRKRPELERWQLVFQVYPDIDTFPAKDLRSKHTSKPDCWRYSGRIDGLIILTYGEGLYLSDVEADIQKYPNVKDFAHRRAEEAAPLLDDRPH